MTLKPFILDPSLETNFYLFICLKDKSVHALKLTTTILLYMSLAQEATSLPHLPGLFGTQADRGLKVSAFAGPASIRKINLS